MLKGKNKKRENRTEWFRNRSIFYIYLFMDRHTFILC